MLLEFIFFKLFLKLLFLYKFLFALKLSINNLSFIEFDLLVLISSFISESVSEEFAYPNPYQKNSHFLFDSVQLRLYKSYYFFYLLILIESLILLYSF